MPANDKLTITYKTPSGPHTTTADTAPVGAVVDVDRVKIGDFYQRNGNSTASMSLVNETGSCAATASDHVMEGFGHLIANGRTVRVRAVLAAVMSPSGVDGETVPCLRISEVFAVDTDLHEIGWGDGGQEHAEVMAWAAEDGRPIIYTDAQGKKFQVTFTPHEV